MCASQLWSSVAEEVAGAAQSKSPPTSKKVVVNGNQDLTKEELIQRNREEMFRKMAKSGTATR